jgi:hypothetical protein
MSYRYFPLKSVLLKGTLENDITYTLCPATEFSEGLWTIAINSLTYECIIEGIEIKQSFSISCNLVKSQKLSSTNQVESYDQPLNVFIFDSKLKKKTIYFDKLWFQINAVSNELKFTIKNVEQNENVTYANKITLHVLFQRVI